MKTLLVSATACCLAISNAHAGGGLAQALANAGVIAQGYQGYQYPQAYPPPAAYGYNPYLQTPYQSYVFPNGQRLNCMSFGMITQCH